MATTKRWTVTMHGVKKGDRRTWSCEAPNARAARALWKSKGFTGVMNAFVKMEGGRTSYQIDEGKLWPKWPETLETLAAQAKEVE